MAHLTISRFGEPADVVAFDPAGPGEPGPGQLRVRMEAAPVNDSDVLLVRGTYPVHPALPAAVGAEGVGRVVEAGPSASAELVGRRVLVLPTYEQGTWADEIVVAETGVVPVDGDADPLQLAMTGINPATAWVLLHRFATLEPGDVVAQTAANSGVGLSVVALARQLKLRTVNVVRREAAADVVRRAGGDEVIVAGEDGSNVPDAVASALGGEKLALVLDGVGGPAVGALAHELRFGGRAVSYAFLSGRPPQVSPLDLVFNEVATTGFWLINWLRSAPRTEVLETYRQLAGLVASGELTVPVEATYALADHAEAFAHAARTRRGGKVLFRFDPA
jgi:NADPH:quinone reductase-like Zn-dependent oxidoreductase